MSIPYEPLRDFVRQADRDRYISTLFAPADTRKDLLALYAFNAELARIREVTTEAALGEIRLKWWSDAISSGATGHPVADAVNATIAKRSLPSAAFLNMVEARRFDLYNDPMPSRNYLEGYCGETAGALIQLASLVLDPKAAVNQGDTAAHGGCAQAITGILALLPIHKSRGQNYFPADLMSAAGLKYEDAGDPPSPEAEARAIRAMAALAREHLSAFKEKAARLPPSLLPAYLPVSFVGPWLSTIEKAGTEAIRRPVRLSPLRRTALMLYRAMAGW